MSTHRRTWQKREQSAAALFGASRQYGSGSGGRADQTTSDSDHPRIYLETKTYARQAVRSLWRDTLLAARKEGKTAVLALYEKSKAGALLVIHESDLDAVCEERRKALVSAPAADAAESGACPRAGEGMKP